MEKTLGEKRIRTDFNVTSNDLVGIIKNDSAQLIDLINGIESNDPMLKQEFLRLKALALTHYEIAAMFAVKAATF